MAQGAEPLPFVTVVMPVRNEAGYIKRSLAAVLNQDYPADRLEVIVADGRSTDGTPAIVEDLASRHPGVRLIDNPGLTAPAALNRATAVASGAIIARVDGHCEIAPDYIRRAVRHLLAGEADGVGGPIETVGETPTARVIAAAMSSAFGVGGSAFRTVKDRTLAVDTIAFPVYTREIIEHAGRYDEELIRNQDDEYNYRLRKMGARLLLAADVKSRYYSRGTIASLFRQYFQYGYWKVRVLRKHPRQMSPRQFVPPVFVAALLGSAGIATVNVLGWWPLAVVLGTYVVANLLASVKVVSESGLPGGHALLLPVVFAVLHVSYGLGFLAGLVRSANRRAVTAVTTGGKSPAMLVFAASVATVLAFWTILPDSLRREAVPDYVSFYEPVGRAILDKGIPVWPDGSPATRYPPGYPLMVAAVLGAAQVLRVPEDLTMDVFVLVAYGLTAVAVFGLARLVWGQRPAVLAAAVWMTYPFALWLTRQPSSDFPFMAVLFPALWLWATTLQARRLAAVRFLAVGFVIGYAMLMRPIALGLGVGVASLTWVALRDNPMRARTIAAALILVGNLLVVLPWEVWVYQKTGAIIPLSTNGLPSMRDGLTFAVPGHKGRVGIWVPGEARAVMQTFADNYSGLRSFGAVAALMRDQMRERPLGVVTLYLVKVTRSWYGTDSQRFDRPILAVQLIYLTGLFVCGRRAWRQHGSPRSAAVGIVCLVGYFQVMNLVGLPLLRYSVPAVGLAMVLLPALAGPATVTRDT